MTKHPPPILRKTLAEAISLQDEADRERISRILDVFDNRLLIRQRVNRSSKRREDPRTVVAALKLELELLPVMHERTALNDH